jgi:hypothetical protein
VIGRGECPLECVLTTRLFLQATVVAAAAVVGGAGRGEAVGLDAVVCVALTGAMVAAMGASAVYNPPSLSPNNPPDADDGEWQGLFDEQTGGSDALRWTLLTLVGCVPLLNWSAWLLMTLEEGESRRARYVLLAALYAAPYVRCVVGGGGVDAFALLSVGACAAHLQVPSPCKERERERGA